MLLCTFSSVGEATDLLGGGGYRGGGHGFGVGGALDGGFMVTVYAKVCVLQ